MMGVWIAIRNDREPNEVANSYCCWPTKEQAESWCYELRQHLGCSIDAVQPLYLSLVGKDVNQPHVG